MLHIQPPQGVEAERRGRQPALADLACRTGGAYVFLDSADLMIDRPSILRRVAGRIPGAWRLQTTTTLDEPALPAGAWAVSTMLEATIEGVTRSHAMQRARDAGAAVHDGRLWFSEQ